jgi:hypothetical protein
MQTRLWWHLRCGLAEASSGVQRSNLCWRVWQESGLSLLEEVFTINLLDKKFYKLCTFNVFHKDSAAELLFDIKKISLP